jgi:hypothetical protein
MTNPTPLSPAAQAVRRDLAQIMHELHQRCRVSVSATDTLPITLETNDASLQAGIDSLCAAALRAAAEELQYRLFLPGSDPMVINAKALFKLANELEGAQ